MQKASSLTVCLLLSLFFCAGIVAQFEAIQQVIDDDRNFSGVVLIASGNSVLYEACKGFRDREYCMPLLLGDQFWIGSLTKQITAVLILKLVDRGLVQLDDEVSKFFPDGRYDYLCGVTIHHLLTHTSGLINYEGEWSGIPGECLRYSNKGYDILGEVVEQVTGVPFHVTVNSFFKQLEMSQSCMSSAAEVDVLHQEIPELVSGYLETTEGNFKKVVKKGGKYGNPAAGAVSSAFDLIKWNMLLHCGKILKNDAYGAFCTPYAARPHRWGDISYGYGIQTSMSDGIVELSHGGWAAGFVSMLLFYPEYNISVVVLENCERCDLFCLGNRVRCAVREMILQKLFT